MPPADVQLDQLERMIVVRLGSLGDIVRTMPAVQALRAAAPQARIAWRVDDRWAGILEGLQYVDELLVVPRAELRAASRNPFAWLRWLRTWRAFRRRLAAWRADAVFDFHGLFKTAVLTACTGAPRRIGYVRGHSKEGSWRAYNVLVDPGPIDIPRLERNLALVEQFGATRPPDPPQLAFTRAERVAVDGVYASLDEPGVVALCPGSSRQRRTKRWPADSFGALADLLTDTLGLTPLVVAGPGEEALADAIRRAARCDVVVAPPLTLKELALVLGRARCYVGGDTGPMHIASIMGTPVVAIFGPTNRVQNRPMPYSPWRIVEPAAGERSAMRWTCGRQHTAAVRPEHVLDVVAELLGLEPTGAARG